MKRTFYAALILPIVLSFGMAIAPATVATEPTPEQIREACAEDRADRLPIPFEDLSPDEPSFREIMRLYYCKTATNSACIPTPIIPQNGAILDNSREDRADLIIWDFDWSDCPGATQYHLYVIGENARNPVIDIDTLSQSSHREISAGYIGDRNRLNWTWKVRAKINGEWGEWSEIRTFDVEPLNTDPPSRR
ncbi:MAG: hypothetical protein ACP5D7_13215 [Limnospira sp.]